MSVIIIIIIILFYFCKELVTWMQILYTLTMSHKI
jgi:hypothetical protein